MSKYMKLVQFVPWTNKNKYRIMTHYKAVHVARKLIEDGGKKRYSALIS